MSPNSPILDEERMFKDANGVDQPSNIASKVQMAIGDVDQGFAEADYIVEREFTTKMVHQGYIEPQNATAFWSSDGNLTIWTSTQGAFPVRTQSAAIHAFAGRAGSLERWDAG